MEFSIPTLTCCELCSMQTEFSLKYANQRNKYTTTKKITYLNEFPYAIEKNHKTRTKNYLHVDFCKFSHLYYVMTSGQPLTHIFHILRSISDDNAR